MTIVAAVRVYDGIVLGADSSTQLFGRDPQGKPQIIKSFQNAQKLFQFQKLPIGILIYGSGNIGKKSIQTLLREFNQKNPYPAEKDYKIEEIASHLLAHFREIYADHYKDVRDDSKPPLGFLIAGYSKSSSMGEEWEFILPPDSKPRIVSPPDIFGASWRGISIPFTRLYRGLDVRIQDELVKSGVSAELIQGIANKFVSPIPFDGMPINDAIKFVKFVLRTTIGLAYFEVGSPSCSEPISVAVITPDEGFRKEEGF